MIELEKKLFSVDEICQALNSSQTSVRRILKERNLRAVYLKKGRAKTGFYNYAVYKLIEEVLRQSKKARKVVTIGSIAKAAEHPLVTDKRLLNTYFFPDVVPDCFKEKED